MFDNYGPITFFLVVVIGGFIVWLCKKIRINLNGYILWTMWGVGILLTFIFNNGYNTISKLMLLIGIVLLIISSSILFYNMFSGRPFLSKTESFQKYYTKYGNKLILIVIILVIIGFIYLYITLPH